MVKEILETHEQASGQKVNLDKTDIMFRARVRGERRLLLVNQLGVRLVAKHEKYLGFSTVVRRSKKVIMKGVKEKIWKKLQGWKVMILSKAENEVLIKAIAQSIPTYVMSVFKIPSSFCDEIRSLVAQFWWGKKEVKERYTG